jgi:hypothetical protein
MVTFVVTFDAILGGKAVYTIHASVEFCLCNSPAAEDVLGDPGVWQAIRAMSKNARL